VFVVVAVAGAFGFVVFLAANAPEVETARIARPTRIVFFMGTPSLSRTARSQSTVCLPCDGFS